MKGTNKGASCPLVAGVIACLMSSIGSETRLS